MSELQSEIASITLHDTLANLHSLNTIYNTTNCMLLPLHVLCFHLDEQSFGPVLHAYGLFAPALLGFFTLLWQQIESQIKWFRPLGRNRTCCGKTPLPSSLGKNTWKGPIEMFFISKTNLTLALSEMGLCIY